MRRRAPTTGQIDDALRRVTASKTFARSERARDLLRYLVTREQAGEADQIKGFAIALDVFGRDSKFDPSTDAVVRVQASRLRDLLSQYYAAEGAADPLRIDIRRGNYAPDYTFDADETFEEAVPVAEPPKTALAHAGPTADNSLTRRFGQLAIAIAVLALFGAASLFASRFWVAPGGDLVGSINPGSMKDAQQAFLPVVHIESTGDGDADDHVAAIFRQGLARFDTVDLIASNTALPRAPSNPDAFTLRVVPGASPETTLVELIHAASGTIVYSRTIDANDRQPVADIVAAILTSVVPVSGAIYAYLTEHGLHTPLTRCLRVSENYYRDQTQAGHLAAYQCWEDLVDTGVKSPLAFSEMSGLELEAVTDHYDYPEDASIDQALDYARRAVQLGPTCPYAHRAYGFLQSRIGNTDESIDWMRKAYELNKFDLSMAASYAYALIFASQYGKGEQIMQRAVSASSSHPSWWDYSLALARIMLGRIDDASRAASAYASTGHAHYIGSRLVLAHLQGRDREAAQLLAKLGDSRSQYAANPRGFYENAKYPTDMTDRLVSVLADAGLGRGS